MRVDITASDPLAAAGRIEALGGNAGPRTWTFAGSGGGRRLGTIGLSQDGPRVLRMRRTTGTGEEGPARARR